MEFTLFKGCRFGGPGKVEWFELVSVLIWCGRKREQLGAKMKVSDKTALYK